MKIKDRIKSLRRVKASDLVPNPRNWRTHPQAQRDALRDLLAEIGYAGVLLVRKLPDGRLMIIDGHLRAETTPDEMVPVLVLDVTEEEANKILATFDPLGAAAEVDQQKLGELLHDIETESEAVQALLDGLEEMKPEERDTILKQLDVKPPPVMTWTLIGIPTVRYGEIAEQVERLANTPDIVIEMTANDG